VARAVSIRELRNHTARVVDLVRSGERVSLTARGVPVADIVPHVEERSPWLPAETLRRLVEEAGADAALLDDLAEVRGARIDEP
jgi:prevent-host-death family protein